MGLESLTIADWSQHARFTIATGGQQLPDRTATDAITIGSFSAASLAGEVPRLLPQREQNRLKTLLEIGYIGGLHLIRVTPETMCYRFPAAVVRHVWAASAKKLGVTPLDERDDLVETESLTGLIKLLRS